MFKLIRIQNDLLLFESLDGAEIAEIYSEHVQDCCEEHYLDFKPLSLEDFEGLIFDFYADNFFERVEGYGIKLISIDKRGVSIAGYAYNNGYYSDGLTIVICIKKYNGKNYEEVIRKVYDITSCQHNCYFDW